MKNIGQILMVCAIFVLISCSAEQRADMEATKLDSFNLSGEQRIIADALVTGYKTDSVTSLLRSSDYARAACYAKAVKMPATYRKAHLAYLADYAAADKEFYSFMKRNGLNEDRAAKLSGHFHDAYEKCP